MSQSGDTERTMRIAILQSQGSAGDVPGNLARLAGAAAEAAERGARVLVLPEMFLSGYNIGPSTVAKLAEPADGPSSLRAAEIAAKCGLAVLYGYPERDGDAVYNAARLIDRDGRPIANYRKSHLFGDIDRSAFHAGAACASIAAIDDWRVAILICYDVEFPENARVPALAGADLLLVPTALMRPYAFIARTMVPARAYENQLFVAYANRCGVEGELEYYGESCIIGPDGSELARAGDRETVICAELDRDALNASRALNTYLTDRRSELYAELLAPARDGRSA